MVKHKQSELGPIDWPGIEREYRAGIKPLRVIAAQFGCSHGAINKRAKRDQWLRDLKPKIHARADDLVSKALVSIAVSTERTAGESETVEVNAHAEVAVRLGHRKDIGRARRITGTLFAELEAVVQQPDLYGIVHMALHDPNEQALDTLRAMAELVASLPARVKVMKDLAETLSKVIGMEREAFGLDTASGTDGRPMVYIRDFTGRGSIEAPQRPQEPS